jgi:hypothetical protein
MNCEEAQKIIANGEKKSWLKTLALKMHLRVCHCCEVYQKQLERLISQYKKIVFARQEIVTPEKIVQLENEILKKIKNH